MDDQDDDEFQAGIDGCHHGVGWDEDCDHCEWEIAAEAAEARRQARLKRQPDLFEGSGQQRSGD